MILKIVILFAATIVAFWISTICGGGASLILIPLLNILLPTSVVPFSLTVGTFANSVSRIVVFRKHIHWKIALWFIPFSIPAVLLGAWFIKFANPIYLQLMVAVFLIANLPLLFRSQKVQQQHEKPYPKFVLAFVGFFAGFVSGITGAIGLLFNRFYLNYGLTKEGIIATRAANEILLHLIKLVIYFLLGLYSTNALWLGLTIAVASILSTYTIKYILPFISDFLFKKLGYAAMVVSGFILLASTSQKVVEENNIQVGTTKIGKEKETTIRWRESDFILEFEFDEGLEIGPPNYLRGVAKRFETEI
ncbi:MAG: sulfite exporter TauE/SafE family protein [Cyclobacteriaceae bacterium]